MRDELALRTDVPNTTSISTDTFKISNPELVKQGVTDANQVQNAEADQIIYITKDLPVVNHMGSFYQNGKDSWKRQDIGNKANLPESLLVPLGVSVTGKIDIKSYNGVSQKDIINIINQDKSITKAIYIKTTPEQDKKTTEYFDNIKKNEENGTQKYNLYGIDWINCALGTTEGSNKGNVGVQNNSVIPKKLFEQILFEKVIKPAQDTQSDGTVNSNVTIPAFKKEIKKDGKVYFIE